MPDKNKKDNNKKKLYILVTILIVVLIAAVACFSIFFTKVNKEDDKNVAYTQLIMDINDNKIEKIEMTVDSTSIKVTRYKDTDEKRC